MITGENRQSFEYLEERSESLHMLVKHVCFVNGKSYSRHTLEIEQKDTGIALAEILGKVSFIEEKITNVENEVYYIRNKLDDKK